jgi:hypothetical protein
MAEDIFTGGEPFLVTIEFEGQYPLRIYNALFEALVGKTTKISGESSIDFNVMYAGELATVLIALEEAFEYEYYMDFRWTEGRTGLYIIVEAL